MEDPSSFPTSADYAYAAASSAERGYRQLEVRVKKLEDLVQKLLKKTFPHNNLFAPRGY